jgi:hypothetical protein
MRDVYLDFRLPLPAKIAAGMLTPEKWWSFEIYLFVTWNAPTSITHHCHFSDFFSQKSEKSSGFLNFFFCNFGQLFYKRAYSKTDFGTKNVCVVLIKIDT